MSVHYSSGRNKLLLGFKAFTLGKVDYFSNLKKIIDTTSSSKQGKKNRDTVFRILLNLILNSHEKLNGLPGIIKK